LERPVGVGGSGPESLSGVATPIKGDDRAVSQQGMRFVIVGIANTAIDFMVLWLLTTLGVPLIPANLASTSTGLAFSFAVNRRFTFDFRGPKPAWRQAVEYATITLVGLWLIQPPIIAIVRDWLTGFGVASTSGVLIGKLLATAVTVVWNFTLYRVVVFRRPREADEHSHEHRPTGRE
jgi:putative flippase GtrA